MMNFTSMMLVLLFAISLFSKTDGFSWSSKSESRCSFKGIISFGDAYSDTGVMCAAFTPQRPPNGMTHFRKPVGRFSDGRLFIDFLAQALGFRYLDPYLNPVLTDFTNGVNFAAAGAPVLMPNISVYNSGVSPFYLKVQLDQLKLWKSEVAELESSFGRTNLPKSDIFGKSLYIFYIGQTDFTVHLSILGVEGVKQYFPNVVSALSNSVEEAYALGGRTFLVFNIAPVGCYAEFLVMIPHNSSDLDAYGCFIAMNNAVQEYNMMLKQKIIETRQRLLGATVVYVDSYSVLLDMFHRPASHGFKYGIKACCGYGGGSYNYNPQAFCGYSKVINGKKAASTACRDPQNYVSWDGVHLTEAANKILASAIINGSFSDPPFPFSQFCDLHPIL